MWLAIGRIRIIKDQEWNKDGNTYSIGPQASIVLQKSLQITGAPRVCGYTRLSAKAAQQSHLTGGRPGSRAYGAHGNDKSHHHRQTRGGEISNHHHQAAMILLWFVPGVSVGGAWQGK